MISTKFESEKAMKGVAIEKGGERRNEKGRSGTVDEVSALLDVVLEGVEHWAHRVQHRHGLHQTCARKLVKACQERIEIKKGKLVRNKRKWQVRGEEGGYTRC